MYKVKRHKWFAQRELKISHNHTKSHIFSHPKGMTFLKFNDPSNATLRVAIGVVSIVILMSVLSRLSQSRKVNYTNRTRATIKKLIQQSAQDATIARQSTNPVIALEHASYALQAARSAGELVAKKEDIAKMTGVKYDELQTILEAEKQQYIRKINNQCPSLQPEGAYVTATGWIGK